MSQLSLELLKMQVRRLANRDVEIEKTKLGKFIPKFIDFNMSPASLLSDSEEEAYQKLIQYLKSKQDSHDPETPPAA